MKNIKKIPLKERDIRRTVMEYIKLKKYFYWHNLAALGCYAGLPDIFVLHNCRICGIEFKTDKGKLSETQQKFQTQMEHAGGLYFAIKSLEDFLLVEKIIS